MTGSHWCRTSAPLLAAAVLWAGLACDAAAQGSAAADRAALEALYDATGGPGWADSTNWKTATPIGEWFGVTTDSAGRVTTLNLFRNRLSGPIPTRLGDLTALRGLILGLNNLTGPIPDELGNLANLEDLRLGANALTGSVPAWLGRLPHLRRLDLGPNDLTGPIPDELDKLTGLEQLNLWENALTGPIPAWLGRLTGLRSLSLSRNYLTGPVPAELGNLANLRYLLLSSNPLTGSLPRSLTRLSQLSWLDISRTGVCAPDDTEFQAWLAGIDFDGDTCNRSPEPVGAIPPQALVEYGPALGVSMEAWFRDPDGDPLTYVAASSHEGVVTAFVSGDTVWLVPGSSGASTVTVTARDPDGLSATQAMAVTTAASAEPQSDREVLEALYDSTGGVVDWTDSTNWKTAARLGEWHGVTTDPAGRVTRLELPGNGLTGVLPAALGKLALLQVLDLGPRWDSASQQDISNALTGPIPRALGQLANLRTLDLAKNLGLTGPIPGELGNLVNLEELDLWWNALTGPIPGELGNLMNLRALSLFGNNLIGPIPGELGNLMNLEVLLLAGNRLTGSIPGSLGRLSSLWHLWLTLNKLTGPIPGELGNLANLRLLRLDNNALTGSIPGSLGSLANLEALDLHWNALTGPIPPRFGNLANLELLSLEGNALTGPIPAELGNLTRLREVVLGANDLSGPIPGALGRLENLERLFLDDNWTLTGSLPAGLESSRLEELDIFVTQACAPAALQDWLGTIEFFGQVCGSGMDVIDVAVVYTPAAREASGGAAAIAAVIDLMVAEANQAYEASGIHHRLALVERSEVAYTETGTSGLDLDRLADPSDGHLDEVHGLRDRVGADLVHLIVDADRADVGGIANLPGAFSLSIHTGGGRVFAHELGHNMGLRHDRYHVHHNETVVRSHPAYGYVNQQALGAGAGQPRRWRTLMSYDTQCQDAHAICARLLRFSNPRQSYSGDPLGIPHGTGSGVTGPADAAAVLNAMGPAVAVWRDRSPGANRPPTAVSTLPGRRLDPRGTLTVDVSQAFADPDGDPLSYTATSSAPDVVTVQASGARVTLTAVGEGVAAIQVTATDPGGLSATQSFGVTVGRPNRPPEAVGSLSPVTVGVDEPPVIVEVSGAFRDPDDDHLTYRATSSALHVVTAQAAGARVTLMAVSAGTATIEVAATDPDGLSATQSFQVRVTAPFTDDPIVPGVTPVRAVHFTELRTRIDKLRSAAGLTRFSWTDPVLQAGVTRVRRVHLLELRAALTEAYGAAGRLAPRWTDASPAAGSTPIRAAHLTELRVAVLTLE